MKFGDALEAIKSGRKIARKGWNGKGMYVYYVPAATYPAHRNEFGTLAGEFPGDMVPYNEYMAIRNTNGTVSTWVPSVNDCFAEDWYIKL